jgi:hypothetical protein
MKRIPALLLLLLPLMAQFIAAEGRAPHIGNGPHHATASPNPLIEEMIKLDEVFRDVVSAVAVSDNARVHKALESMHGAMEMTHEGVHAGAVKISRNPDKVEEFVRMDKEFHDKLEALAHAAHDNDQKKMVLLTKELLDGCVNCHQIFRK